MRKGAICQQQTESFGDSEEEIMEDDVVKIIFCK